MRTCCLSAGEGAWLLACGLLWGPLFFSCSPECPQVCSLCPEIMGCSEIQPQIPLERCG